MNVFSISWNSLKASKLTAFLNILLISFGTGILSILLLASYQVEQKLENNARDIDLVVGAKGSPLQLILSSIFYIDFPTGNIPLKDAELLASNRMVRRAVPLALGDNYNGFRIVGTDTNFIGLYKLKLSGGKFWKEDFEVTIGSNVAEKQKLNVGDEIYGAHGLASSDDTHGNNVYLVSGILEPQGNVTDNLVLTNISSVWKMHEEKHLVSNSSEIQPDLQEKEITSLLIQYNSPTSIVMFPMMVNKSTNMQAASPAKETARLFSLIGVGVDTLKWFAILIMSISAISVFISLYNSLKERKYDLAIMRTMGASRFKLFLIVLLEGIILTTIGSLAGMLLAHLGLHLIAQYQDSTQAKLSGTVFLRAELYILIVGLGIGMIASLIPAIQAYRSDISKILSKN
jgi:putative ABC transport system permease protein